MHSDVREARFFKFSFFIQPLLGSPLLSLDRAEASHAIADLMLEGRRPLARSPRLHGGQCAATG